jgi:glycosyltransferase involved in cell wall biosynthesis
MKVAVYAIALNEEQFVKRWYHSAKEADLLLIADTGSTDKTVELAKSFGIETHVISVQPWRFDDARNASLALIPGDYDYCIALDLDEVLVPGWREHLEKAYVNICLQPAGIQTDLQVCSLAGLESTLDKDTDGYTLFMNFQVRTEFLKHEAG